VIGGRVEAILGRDYHGDILTKACVDAHYEPTAARGACVLFHDWSDAAPARELVASVPAPADYEPGKLYLRELPCLLAVLERVKEPLELVIVDGYVWLDADEKPGLGAHLHAAMRVPVVGVAKTAFKGGDFAVPVLRGTSRKPLFVTAVGIAPEEAARCVEGMHGPHRLPTLLKRVDQLARSR
jgi:deoxyribonuclease V